MSTMSTQAASWPRESSSRRPTMSTSAITQAMIATSPSNHQNQSISSPRFALRAGRCTASLPASAVVVARAVAPAAHPVEQRRLVVLASRFSAFRSARWAFCSATFPFASV